MAGMLVAEGGKIIDIIVAGTTEPPKRPSRRFIGSVEEVAARAERRRLEEQARLYEEAARIAATWRSAR